MRKPTSLGLGFTALALSACLSPDSTNAGPQGAQASGGTSSGGSVLPAAQGGTPGSGGESTTTPPAVGGTPIGPTWDAPAGSPVSLHGNLTAADGRIFGSHGKPTQLRGMSLYWSQIDEGGRYYNADTISFLASDWKAQIVRAAIGVTDNPGFKGPSGDYLTNPEHHEALLDQVVQAAVDAGIYVLIDFHDHHANEHLEQAKTFFSKAAEKYGSYPNVIYELWNEPRDDVSWTGDIKPYAEAISEVIRAHDPDNLMVVGTPHWDQRPHEVIGQEVDDPNVAYSLHFYAGSEWHFFGTGPAGIGENAQAAVDAGIPLFVTEWGTTSHDNSAESFNEAETRKWMKFLDENFISSCNWSITAVAEASAAVLPSASPSGGWSDSDISPSGKLLKKILAGE